MHLLKRILDVLGPSAFLVLDTATITAGHPRAIATTPSEQPATTTAANAHRAATTTNRPTAVTASTTRCFTSDTAASAAFPAATTNAAVTTTIVTTHRPAQIGQTRPPGRNSLSLHF